MTGKTRAGRDPSWIGPELLQRDWTCAEISTLYDRVINLLDQGEGVGAILRRLNPDEAITPPDQTLKARRTLPVGADDLPWDLWARVQRQKARF